MLHPSKIPHSLPPVPRSFAPFLTALLSVPLAFLFSLGFQGEASAYIIGIISLGLLTALDLRRGLFRLLLGFAASLIASLYVIERSVVGQGLSPVSFGDWSLLLAALPSAIGVFAAGLLLSEKTKYKFVKANLLASASLAIGIGIGSALKAGGNPSLDLGLFPSITFMLLCFPANGAQMVLIHFLNKLWKARRFSLTMMPTAFFAFNLLTIASYLSSHNTDQLYAFLSSFGFLPALTLVGLGTGSLVGRPTVTAVGAPRLTITGDSLVRQGREQTIMIITKSGGKPKGMATINAKMTKPGGKVEPLKLRSVGLGEYKALYRPGTIGNYTVHIIAAGNERVTADQSFSFTVQAPAAQHSPPAPPSPVPQSRLPQQPPPPLPSPPIQRPAIQSVTPGSTRLDSWDPKVWVNQEVHGYWVREHIATGLTGYVLRASFEQGGTEMAIKIPILRTGKGTTSLEETMSEATRLLELSGQSKYVVQLRGILVDRLNVQEILKGNTSLYLKSPPAIVMELMKGGAAKALVEDSFYDSLYYSEKWGNIVILIGYMIATGLETIHKAGFVHLDVKPQNILFNVRPPATGLEMIDQMRSGALVPKLADLGSAVRIGGKINQFTSEYAPAEQVLGYGAAPSMDVYALGATMYNMLTKTPVNSKRLIDMMNNISRSSESDKAANDLKSTWNSFDPDFARIAKFPSITPVLKKILERDPRHRPEAGSVATSLRNSAGIAMPS